MPRLLPSLLFLACSAAVSAQSYTARKIQFSDPGTFTQAQLEETVGIHAGPKVTARLPPQGRRPL